MKIIVERKSDNTGGERNTLRYALNRINKSSSYTHEIVKLEKRERR